MAVTQVKIGGLGGQGVIMSGMILGKAASIFEDKSATMTQAFGPEARGSAVSCQVIVSDDQVLYPYLVKADILCVMSQEAYNKYLPDLAEDGLLLIEEELVTPTQEHDRIFGIPATRFAEDLGRKMVVNIVMMGFFAAVTGLVSKEAALTAVRKTVPPKTIELNSSAFEQGYQHGLKVAGKA
jgi:2-oxoglutarate ferredoxin oxidoreductase subunit gamma